MTNEKSYVNMMTTNPVLTVAPPKEETEMFGATERLPHSIADFLRRMKGPASLSPLKIKKVSCFRIPESTT